MAHPGVRGAGDDARDAAVARLRAVVATIRRLVAGDADLAAAVAEEIRLMLDATDPDRPPPPPTRRLRGIGGRVYAYLRERGPAVIDMIAAETGVTRDAVVTALRHHRVGRGAGCFATAGKVEGLDGPGRLPVIWRAVPYPPESPAGA